jgi:hypothetical protein
MDGPFSHNTITSILRGPFFVSPLIVSVQPQGLGMPDKLRVCRHLSKSNKLTPSVNSHTRKEDFSTRFDTASRVADIVSIPCIHRIELVSIIPKISFTFIFMTIGTSKAFYRRTLKVITSISTFIHHIQIRTTSSNPSSTLLVPRSPAGIPAGTLASTSLLLNYSNRVSSLVTRRAHSL